MSNSRAIIIIVFILLVFAALVIKLVDIQIVRSEELKYYAQRQQTNLEKIDAERGMIYDRNNVLLVYNRNDYSFYLDLRMVSNKGKKKIAEKFSSVFGKSKNYYYNLMSDSGKIICLEKKAPGEKAFLLTNFKINGLFYKEDPTRVYHYGDLASHVLGFVGTEDQGVNGIEKAFDKQLGGENGTRLVERDAIGDMITVAEEETKPAVPGDNLVLTINKTYQAILEEELRKGLSEYGGTAAIGIIMDPNTGEILSLANMNDYDPNKYWEYSDDERRNRAVTDTYEPGSTFKSITMAALLDQKLVNENDKVFVENGKYKFKNISIFDTHKHSWLTVKGVMEESSDIGMAKLVQNIDDDLFYKYVRAFGFGNYTSTDLPGEVKGKLKKPNEWSQFTKTFMSFGYEVAVTPIQLITAYSAIINGGILYQPQLIKREVSHNGKIVMEFSPKEVRAVISPQTSAEMRKILVGVVKNGTGQNAKLDFITVGGKTGTSQKLINGSYSKSDYNSSFIGFFPAEKPKIICLILVISPEKGKYGGFVAAPIFKNVAQRIINTDVKYFQDQQPDQMKKGNDLKVVFADNKKNGKENLVPAGKPVKILGDNLGAFATDEMPDLINYNLRDGIKILNRLGLKYKVNGSGIIISQSIKAGEKISKGLLCNIDCKEIKINGASVY